ncbi:MAG: hypothetical protein WCI18_02735 [Pseudomonadota bacterium]
MKMSIFTCLVAIVACNSNSNFKGGSASKKAAVSNAKPGDPSGDANSTGEERIGQSGDGDAKAIASLANLCSSGVMKTRSIVVNIPSNSGAKCPFGQGDNLGESNGKITARIEKDFPLDIPKSHKVCGMKADASNQPMRYDDHLFLTLNGNVLLASTTEADKFLTGSNGFKQYDWNKIKGQDSSDPPSYCGPGLTCKLPRTQVEGDFNFTISQDASSKIFGPLLGSDLKFSLILTGDNDPSSDCQLNTSLKVNLSYSYVE